LRAPPALYLITDRRACSRPLPDAVAEAIAPLDPGRVAVQLREKDLTARALFELGRAVQAICQARGVSLFINDRLDVARALGADGVHLGSDSLPTSEVRRLWPQARIGISCHSPEELAQRREGADFATWGPVFSTPSKAAWGPAIGTSRLAEALALGLPLLALGGVDESRAAGLAAHRFAGLACIRAVFSAQDPGQAARALLAAFDGA